MNPMPVRAETWAPLLWQRRLLWLGFAGIALAAVGAFWNFSQFFHSYLFACIFWTGTALGCLAIAMIHNLTAGAWGSVARRPLECGARVVALMAALFVPLVIFFPGQLASRILEYPPEQQAYLSAAPFVVRQVLYFGIWIWLAFRLGKLSEEQDRERAADSPAAFFLGRKLRRISAPGLILYAVTVSLAAVDWIMAFQSGWSSSVFGLILIGGQLLSGVAFIIVCLEVLSRPLQGILEARHFHDLGKLLLCFVMIWAYLSFSQLLIIWSANLPSEIPWYLRRWSGRWESVEITLLSLHFGLPFVLLLSRRLKRSGIALAGVAAFVLVMRAVDVYWMVGAEASEGQIVPHWMDFAAAIGVGGVWLAFFLLQLRKRPLIPATLAAPAEAQ